MRTHLPTIPAKKWLAPCISLVFMLPASCQKTSQTESNSQRTTSEVDPTTQTSSSTSISSGEGGDGETLSAKVTVKAGAFKTPVNISMTEADTPAAASGYNVISKAQTIKVTDAVSGAKVTEISLPLEVSLKDLNSTSDVWILVVESDGTKGLVLKPTISGTNALFKFSSTEFSAVAVSSQGSVPSDIAFTVDENGNKTSTTKTTTTSTTTSSGTSTSTTTTTTSTTSTSTTTTATATPTPTPATPGITVTSSSLTTTEAGGTITFTIKLDTAPTANVTIGISSSDTTEGTVSPATLTFTSSNYGTNQTVTVTGVDDATTDGNISYSVVIAAAVSTDSNYNGLNPTDLTLSNTDDDVPGFTLTAISGNTTEAGGTATFTMKLNVAPTANVVIGISSSDTTEGTVSPASLTFTTGNWSTPQTVTVTGVDDSIDDADISYSIVTAAATSTDTNYSGLNPSDVTLLTTDDDTVGFTLGAISGSTTEAGGTATFTMKLASQPSADVVIGISSSNTAEGTVSPSSLTFTSANWNTNQTVTVTGVDDSTVDGNQSYSVVTAAASSSDSQYNSLNPNDVTVSNTDNDTAGFTISAISGSTTEAGATATFTVKLASLPTASVTIGLSSSDTTEGTVSPASLTFTTANWNTNQTVTVTGVDDADVDGNITYSIVTAAASSSDSNYNSLNPSDVSVSNTDNEAAASSQTSKISVSSQHGCAIDASSKLACWGNNSYGEVGDGTTTFSASPIRAANSSWTWSWVTTGGYNTVAFTCAIKSDGTLWCFGRNFYGQLGIGSDGSNSANDPTQVGTDTNWSKVSAGENNACGIKTTGTLWCWGKNTEGQVGDGTQTLRNTPTQVGSDTNWSTVSIGYNHICAIKTTGTLWCWGKNDLNQLGNGGTTDSSSPVQVGTDTNWSYIDAGLSHSCAIKSTGTMWCWGTNNYYQLADGTTNAASTPVQALTSGAADSNWSKVDAANLYTCAIKSTGTLWCWGRNLGSQLGNGTNTDVTTPTQIGSDTWTSMATSIFQFMGGTPLGTSCGIKSAGTYWCWGQNMYYQIGDGSSNTSSSPVSITLP